MPAKFKDLVELAETLRSEKGCPWDRKQTIKSLLKSFVDEAEEVKEAIEKDDCENLKEELGDLLFNMVMISQIAKEKGLFTISDVLKNIEAKIIKRHSWVFGTDKVSTPEEAIEMWKKNKERERRREKS